MAKFDYPLMLKPIAVPRPWGAGRLCKLYDRECVESNQPIGESWDVSTWPTDPGNPGLATVTTVTNGKLAGTPLDKIIDVPVVVKILDAAEKLSVQSHPVKENEHKDEMWYILYAEPDAYLFCGLADGVSKEEFCKVINSADVIEDQVLSMLNKADNLKPGDFFNVPTGTVHAVGPGIVAYEVSEKTQVTYRIYDYNRGRSLHLEDGCKAVLAARSNYPVLDTGLEIEGADSVETITEFPTFCVVKAAGSKVTVKSSKHNHLITATFGDVKISAGNENWNVTIKKSFSCLLPAVDFAYNLDIVEGGEVLIVPLNC